MHRRNIDDEIVRNVAQEAELTWSYAIFMAMSGVLAAVAFLTDSVPILIGAMVVAPALPPLALVAFAMAAGQWALSAKGLGTALVGIMIAIAFSILATWIVNVAGLIPADLNLVNQPLLEERVRPGWYSAIAAIAAGIAAAVAVMKRKTDALIGIVASVALIPAAAAGAISLMSGDPIRALGGFVLLVMNIGLIIAMSLIVIAIARPTAKDEGEQEGL